MNRFQSLFKPLMWFMTLLLAAFVAGCGGGGGSSGVSLTVAPGVTVAPGAAGVAGGTATDPTVKSTSPMNGATNVPTSHNATTGTLVTAIFSQPMDPATINSSSAGALSTFTLKETSGANVPGTVALNAANTVATFRPTASLNTNTSYTATVTTAAKNAGGIAMANPVAWSFTTRADVSIGQAPVDLGTAGNYAILAKTGVSTVPSSVVTGNVGVSPAARTYLTGWSETAAPDASDTYSTSAQVVAPFKLYAADYAVPTPANLTTAVGNMETAYTDAAGRTATSAATTNVGAGTLTSLTLTSGVYEWGSAVTIPTNLTLNGSATDVWIFKVAGTLNMAAAKNVVLTGGALPKNVFWQVSGAVTIGANTHFEGIILGQTGITFGNLASINGRLLAQTAVVLDATTVTQPAP